MLDESLSKRSDYESARLSRIDSLRQVVDTANSDADRYEVQLQLFDEYKSYRYDSAYVYAGRCYVAACQMGITDSERIARFLDYSVHTVNTYKTRVKNKAVVENETFEQHIMEIG